MGDDSASGNPNSEVDDEELLPEQEKSSSWNIRRWVIAIFATLAGLAFSASLFVIPFVIDPAISALQADFNEEPVTCSVKSSTMKIGLTNCFWSSCMEGCTRDLYKCFQIKVTKQQHLDDFHQRFHISG